MTDDRALRRFGKLYAILLRGYPEEFRSRFAQSMQQTFRDLCQERRATGEGYFLFALGLFGDTFVAMLRARAANGLPPRENIVRLVGITMGVLTVPAVGMRVSDGVNWSPMDFVVAGALLFATGFSFEIFVRKSGNVAYRVATGLACTALLLLLWINLAVGIVGSPHDSANLLYLLVLIVGAIGAAGSGLRARRLALASFAMAVAQALATGLAIVVTGSAGAEGTTPLRFVLLLNGGLVLVFLASAALFRRA